MARQQTAQQTAGEAASRLTKFGQATSDEQKKKQPDMVGRIQQYAAQQAEADRKKKEEEERRKKQPVQTAPAEEGFFTRMYKKYVTGESK